MIKKPEYSWPITVPSFLEVQGSKMQDHMPVLHLSFSAMKSVLGVWILDLQTA